VHSVDGQIYRQVICKALSVSFAQYWLWWRWW